MTSLPLANLEIAESVVGKCSSCGHVFKYIDGENVFKYMDKNMLAYRRPRIKRNLAILLIPVVLVIILAFTAAAFANDLPGVWPQQNSTVQTDGAQPSATPAPNVTVVPPTPTPIPQSTMAINGTGRYDVGRGKYYLPVTLSAGNPPVDLQKLTVTVRKDNRTITPNAWEYGEDSCLWNAHNTTGSVLGPNDTATIVVDMSNYNFENGSLLYLDFAIPGRTPLTIHYVMDRTSPVIPLPPVIYNGEYDYVTGKMIDLNDTNIVKVSGRVFVNKWPATNMAVSFYDNYTTTTVTSIEDGFYTIVLKRNQTYRLKVWSSTYGTVMQDSKPRIFMNDTTLDIKLTT